MTLENPMAARKYPMSIETLANYAEIFGGGAVVFSLIYLAFQVRANTREQRHRLRYDHFEIQNSIFNYIVESPEATRIFMKAAEDYQSLDDIERIKFGLMMTKMCHAFDLVMQMRNEGSIDQDTYRGFEGFVFGSLTAPGARYWWENMDFAKRVVPRVRNHIDRLYKEHDAAEKRGARR